MFNNMEKETATCSSILAWEIPWIEEPGRLQSTRSQRVRHNLATEQQQSLTESNRISEQIKKDSYHSRLVQDLCFIYFLLSLFSPVWLFILPLNFQLRVTSISFKHHSFWQQGANINKTEKGPISKYSLTYEENTCFPTYS